MSWIVSWISEQGHALLTAATVALAGFLLYEALRLTLRWLLAWWHARTAPGCVGCARVRVDAVAYPEDIGPLAYCRPCLRAAQHELATAELEPMHTIGLRRPVDATTVVAAVWLAVILAPLAVTLMMRS